MILITIYVDGGKHFEAAIENSDLPLAIESGINGSFMWDNGNGNAELCDFCDGRILMGNDDFPQELKDLYAKED